MRVANSPTQPLIHQNGVVNVPQQHQTPIIQVSENLNSNSGGAVSKKRKRTRVNWTESEDSRLKSLVGVHGHGAWATVAQSMEQRDRRQCRNRWLSHLCPSIPKNKAWSDEEERKVAEGHTKFGDEWAKIAESIPGKSGSDVKRHWDKTMKWIKNNPSTVLESYIREKLISDENNCLLPNATTQPMDNTNTLVQPFTGDNAQLPLSVEDFGIEMQSFTSQFATEEAEMETEMENYFLWECEMASFLI